MKDYDCSCWVPYPNKCKKNDKGWKCVDEFVCVKDFTDSYPQKTRCKRKQKEDKDDGTGIETDILP